MEHLPLNEDSIPRGDYAGSSDHLWCDFCGADLAVCNYGGIQYQYWVAPDGRRRCIECQQKRIAQNFEPSAEPMKLWHSVGLWAVILIVVAVVATQLAVWLR